MHSTAYTNLIVITVSISHPSNTTGFHIIASNSSHISIQRPTNYVWMTHRQLLHTYIHTHIRIYICTYVHTFHVCTIQTNTILCKNNSIGLDWTNQFSQNCEQNGTCEWKHNQLLLYRLLIAHTHLLSVAHKHTKDWTLCSCGVWKDKLWNRKVLSRQTIASTTVRTCGHVHACSVWSTQRNYRRGWDVR